MFSLFLLIKNLLFTSFHHQRAALHHPRVLHPAGPSPTPTNHPFCPDRLRLHQRPALRHLHCPPDLFRPLPSLLTLSSSSPGQLRALSLPPAFRRTPGRPSSSSSRSPRGPPGPPVTPARRYRSVSCGRGTLDEEVHHAGDDPHERRPLRPAGGHT